MVLVWKRGRARRPIKLSTIGKRLRPSSPFIWLILGAGLFLVGAASFSGHGARHLAEIGVVGAVMALAVIAAFLL
jgi:hypothetical protein